MGMNETNLYGRIGTATIVRQRQNEVKAVGGTVERDDAAGTVIGKIDGQTAFKALRNVARILGVKRGRNTADTLANLKAAGVTL
jgi:hypothetical protein